VPTPPIKVLNHLIEISSWSIAQYAIVISEIVTTEMKMDGSGSFQVERVVTCQLVYDALWVFGAYYKDVNIDAYVFIMVIHTSHPYVRFRFGWEESQSTVSVS
jgi:hypothetical protein